MFWVIAIVIVLLVLSQFANAQKQAKDLAIQYQRLSYQYRALQSRCATLEKYKKFAKYSKLPEAETTADFIIQRAKNELQQAHSDAEKIILDAQQKAREIAGNAIDAKENATQYTQIATAMKNIILGYGTDYLIPSETLLDVLSENYGFSQASKDYKNVRTRIKKMVQDNQAATCDYSEASRKQNAINFIVDAFNGKFNTILSKAKSDNFGTLRQKLTDAFTLVNYNGKAFRNARINNDYFHLCIEALRLACLIQEIHQQNIEEQRRIREQLCEEEKARREIDKALKNSTKEELMLQKAIEKIKAQFQQANEAQKTAYETQIAELEQKYREAEERNKRALSMAQQTKSGYVYIISNEGSFGQNVFKIGMTRRLEPLDRVHELSSASVPFPFEVHAMIWSEDAPALETMLHKKFALHKINKVNFRKEFFRLTLSEIRSELEKNSINTQWTMTAQASEYLESLAIDKAIQDNPHAQEDWLNHQIKLENNSNFTRLIIDHSDDDVLDDDDAILLHQDN